MFTNTVSNKWTETAKEIEETIELIIFSLGDVIFGIPVTKIDRIVNKTNLDRDFNLSAEIEILDLLPRFCHQISHSLYGGEEEIFRSCRARRVSGDSTEYLQVVIVRVLLGDDYKGSRTVVEAR